jgi:hypothetical protein
MNFNLIYDSTVSSAPAGFTATVQKVADFFQSTFLDPVTVNISVGYGQINGQPLSAEAAEDASRGFGGRALQYGSMAETQLTAGALGQSSTYLRSYSYNQIKSALAADAKSADDHSAVTSLPIADPTNGGHYWVTTAEAKALNLTASGGLDGYVGFSSTPGIFDYDNSNGVSPGQFDFFAVIAHEFSEVMGRQLLVGQALGGTANSYEVMDLFHYSSASVRDFSGTQPGYFSPDSGATNLNNFNTNPGGDFGDWASSAGNDSAGAFSHSSVVNAFSAADIRVMDTIGWDVANIPPVDTSPSITPSPAPVLALTEVCGDFSGDCKSDILWQNGSGQLTIWVMNGNNVLSNTSLDINPGTSWHVTDAADFDGDGKADVLWQNDSGQASIWLMNGTNVLSTTWIGPNPGTTWHVKEAADFNGDGKSDILWQNDSGQASIWLMNGTNVLSTTWVGPNPGTAWHIKEAADFNGDGKSDILWQNDSGQAAIWLMNGNSVLSTTWVGPNPGMAWHIKGAGDFNSDGKADILWQNDSGQAAIWLMNGTSVLSTTWVGSNPGANWHVDAASDFDGNGKADILWQNDNGQAVDWLMDGTSVVASALIGSNLATSSEIHWA